MESRLKERLVEFAESIEDTPEWRLEVWKIGVRLSYGWLNAQGRYHVEDKLVTWEELENGDTNPLVLAKISLTKIAGGYQ